MLNGLEMPAWSCTFANPVAQPFLIRGSGGRSYQSSGNFQTLSEREEISSPTHDSRKTAFWVTCLPLIGCRSNLLKTRTFRELALSCSRGSGTIVMPNILKRSPCVLLLVACVHAQCGVQPHSDNKSPEDASYAKQQIIRQRGTKVLESE